MPKAGSVTREMAKYAIQLRRESLSWKEVGQRLARAVNRQVPFTDRAVQRAVKNYIEGKL